MPCCKNSEKDVLESLEKMEEKNGKVRKTGKCTRKITVPILVWINEFFVLQFTVLLYR